MHGLRGPNTSTSGWSGTGLAALSLGARTIARGEAKVGLVVGAGRLTTPTARLEIGRLHPLGAEVVPGEGAGALCLEPLGRRARARAHAPRGGPRPRRGPRRPRRAPPPRADARRGRARGAARGGGVRRRALRRPRASTPTRRGRPWPRSRAAAASPSSRGAARRGRWGPGATWPRRRSPPTPSRRAACRASRRPHVDPPARVRGRRTGVRGAPRPRVTPGEAGRAGGGPVGSRRARARPIVPPASPGERLRVARGGLAAGAGRGAPPPAADALGAAALERVRAAPVDARPARPQGERARTWTSSSAPSSPPPSVVA